MLSTIFIFRERNKCGNMSVRAVDPCVVVYMHTWYVIICQFGVDPCLSVYTCAWCLKVFPPEKNVCSLSRVPTTMNVVEKKLSLVNGYILCPIVL